MLFKSFKKGNIAMKYISTRNRFKSKCNQLDSLYTKKTQINNLNSFNKPSIRILF